MSAVREPPTSAVREPPTSAVREPPAGAVREPPAGAPARGWRPAPAVGASIACHVAGAAVVAAEPASWPWIVGFLASHHLAFTAASFAPRSRLIGANLSRLPAGARARGEVALTFDDGPDPRGTPQVLELLDQARARASFFCVGAHLARYPDLAREIVRRGHSIENHTQRHPESFGFYGPKRFARELAAAQATIHATVGIAPAFFRAPFGIRNPLLDRPLHRLGLRYVSWTRRGLDTVDPNVERVARRLTAGLAAGDILVLHDGLATRRTLDRAPIAELLPRVLEALERAHLRSVSLPAGCR